MKPSESSTTRAAEAATPTTLRVLVVSSLGPRPYIGGIENVVDTFMRSPACAHIEWSVYDTWRKPLQRRPIWKKLGFSVRLALGMWKAVRREKPDVVHIHYCSGSDFWKHLICLRVARLLRRPTIFHLHGGSFDRFFPSLSPMRKRLARSIMRRATAHIVLSEYWRTFVQQEIGLHSVHVLPNPIDVESLGQRIERTPDRAFPRLVMIGSLGRRKGYYESITALADLAKEWPDIELHCAGAEEDAGARQALEQLATELGVAERVVFHGPLGFEAKCALLQNADLFLLPSFGENMPISLLEAMSVGVPVIASNVGAIPEVLGDDEYGRILRSVSSGVLLKVVQELLIDYKGARFVAGQARLSVINSHDHRPVGEMLIGCYSAASRGIGGINSSNASPDVC